MPEADKLAAEISETYNRANGNETYVRDFYGQYAVAHDKPILSPCHIELQIRR